MNSEDALDRLKKGEIYGYVVEEALKKYPRNEVRQAIVEGKERGIKEMEEEMKKDAGLRDIYPTLIEDCKKEIEALKAGKKVSYGGTIV